MKHSRAFPTQPASVVYLTRLRHTVYGQVSNNVTTAKSSTTSGPTVSAPPQCSRWRGSYLHKECHEKANENSTPSCCNCTLAESGL